MVTVVKDGVGAATTSGWHGNADPLPSNMNTLVFAAPGIVKIINTSLPTPAWGRVLVKVNVVGICGTDTHLLDGTSPYIVDGLTSFPVRFGHEYAGVVVAVSDGVSPDFLHKRVTGDAIVSCGQCSTCKSGHYNVCPARDEIGVKGDFSGAAAQYFSVPAHNVHQIPQAVSTRDAVLAEPTVTVLSAFEAAALQPGERIAIIGTGTLGLIATQIAARMGCVVQAIGIEDVGLDAAIRSGASLISHPADARDNSADVVLEVSGARSVGSMLTRLPSPAGRVIQIGLAGAPLDGVATSEIAAKTLRFYGVLGGVSLVDRALRLIEAGVVRPELLIHEVYRADTPQQAFSALASGKRARPKVLIDMDSF
ncbi:MAG: zinc-dependent alcohol dehydrogenase [Rhodococcus sp. (in: high G+C Gram-positive bacteria)]